MRSLKIISWIIVARGQLMNFLKKHRSVIRRLIIWLALLLVAVVSSVYVDLGLGCVILYGFWWGWEAVKENNFFYRSLEIRFSLIAQAVLLASLIIAVEKGLKNPLLTIMICVFFSTLSCIFSYYIWLDFEKMWERLGCKSAIENLDFDYGEEFD